MKNGVCKVWTVLTNRTIVKIFLLLAIVSLVLLVARPFDNHIPQLINYPFQLLRSHIQFGRPLHEEECPGVMRNTMQGHWKQRPLTAAEKLSIKTFLKQAREEEHGIPVQRPDGACGNVSFPSKPNFNVEWFRALCNPDGNTPCCENGRCTKKSEEQCKCPECHDIRSPLHAEFSTWVPHVRSCAPHNMSVSEMCSLLKGATLYFVGDSLVRHVFTALLMLIRNSTTGAQKKGIPKDLKTKCAGMYMFTEKVCRHWVDSDVHVCPSQSVHLRYLFKAFNSDGGSILNEVRRLKNKDRTLAFISLGFHNTLNPEKTFKLVMQPLVQEMKAKNWTWPKVVWATIHHWGLLKNPNLKDQSVKHVSHFNKKMIEYLQPWDVAIFDTFNMTRGVESFDGTHYGMGLNTLKVRILFSYLFELRSKGQW